MSLAMSAQAGRLAPTLEILNAGDGNRLGEKRRRNRVILSCLNCHASKRKCNKKRPCSRCINLGLIGLCVYEVEDPAARNDMNTDEIIFLRRRVAELEAVLRQVQKRPHPAWIADGGMTHDLKSVASFRKPRRPFQGESPLSALGKTAPTLGNVIVEQEWPRVAWFTSSAEEYPADSLQETRPSPHSNSIPFTFVEGPKYDAASLCPPLTSYVQTIRGSSSSSYSMGSSPCPSTPFVDIGTRFDLLSDERGGSASEIVSYPSSLNPSINNEADGPDHNKDGGTYRALPSTLQRSSPSPHPTKGRDVCPCLGSAMVFSPLLHFAIALRTSREALQGIHATTSDCELFRKIVDLDNQIFSATPPVAKETQALSHAHAQFDVRGSVN